MKRFLFMAFLALPLLMSARPADPRVSVMTNPDGSKVSIRAFGDENFNYYTDAEASFIYEKDSKGFWLPAVRNGRMLKVSSDDLSLLRAEVSPVTAKLVENRARMASITAEGRSEYPTISSEPIQALVVLVQFDDIKFSISDPVKTFDRMLNEPGFSDYRAKGSARDYYMQCSNGLFNVHFDVAPVVTLSNHHAYYTGWDVDAEGNISKPKDYVRHSRMGILIQEALTQLDPQLDFSKYDLDNNGDIDNIFFFYAGYGQADSHIEHYIWPHQGSYYNHQLVYGLPEINVDGVKMRTYACSNELNWVVPQGESQPWLDGVGAFCHEYGHVLGLPDLYDTAGTKTKTPGNFSIMDQGSYNENSTRPPLFSAYEKWVCRWLEFNELSDPGTYTVSTVSVPADGEKQSAARIRIPRPGPTVRYFPEYFVIESRTNDGYDKSLPEKGMLIWRINFDRSIWSANDVNINGMPRVELMNSSAETQSWPGENNVTYSCPGYNELTFASSNPVFKLFLTDIKFDETEKTSEFGYNLITEMPDAAPVLHERVTVVEGSDNSFYISWDPVEGATDYFLTVTRTDSRGNTFLVNNLNETPVGNVTSYLFENLPANTYMKQTFRAKVRAVLQVPSSATSNEYVFVPSEAIEQYYAGADNIFDDSMSEIAGGYGCINAPDGAEIYNLSGIRTGRDNLPAGVYIVRLGTETVKVLVK